MEIDNDRIDEAALAVLYLTLHEGNRVWKSFDWDTMDRLHRKGYISDPKSKAKSVAMSEEGLARAKEMFGLFFAER